MYLRFAGRQAIAARLRGAALYYNYGPPTLLLPSLGPIIRDFNTTRSLKFGAIEEEQEQDDFNSTLTADDFIAEAAEGAEGAASKQHDDALLQSTSNNDDSNTYTTKWTSSQKRNKRSKDKKRKTELANPLTAQIMAASESIEADIVEDQRLFLTKQVLGFIKSPDDTRTFSNDLTGKERLFIHELAVHAGLFSKSAGQKSKRQIKLFKEDPPVVQPQAPQPHKKKVVEEGSNSQIMLNIGLYGEVAMGKYFMDHPPTEIEWLESHETGSSSSVSNKSKRPETLSDMMMSSQQDDGYSHQPARQRKVIDLERRQRNHAEAQERKTHHASYQKMQKARQQLPAWSRQQEILEKVEQHHVVVLAGETGCGKSTQIPQFLVDANPTASIVVTQPRRISAISVAERVAAEQCLGGVGGMVGYQIRMESAMSPETQVLFLTPGLLLRKLQSDPLLSEFTHIVIDEIHERDKHTEFLLIALKGILPQRPELRVVLMSATMETQTLNEYWHDAAGKDTGPPGQITIPGRTFPVQAYFLEDILAKTKEMEFSRCARPSNLFEPQEALTLERENALLIGYQTLGKEKEHIDNNLILKVLELIDSNDQGSDDSSAVLIFLPGWQEISDLSRLLGSRYPFSDKNKFLVLPLHSGLSSLEQRKVFERPPRGVRKIILSTNIAETSVTIDDVSFVIDAGKAKEKSYDPELHTSTFGLTWISQASAKQRKGRAGRVKEGVCFHLYSKEQHDSLRPFVESELLRTSLEDMCLQTKRLGLAPGGPDDYDGLPGFLSRAMSPPPKLSVDNAMEYLVSVGAMDAKTNNLTSLGRCLSALSLEPHVGKMVIYSHFLGVAHAAKALGVAMSHKSPFTMPPPALQISAGEAHIDLSRNTESDPITVLYALQEYEYLKRDRRAVQDFCSDNFLGRSTLGMMDSLQKNVSRELSTLRFPDSTRVRGYHNRHDHEDDPALWQAAIAAGAYPNVAMRTKGESKFLTKSGQRALIHASSVNSTRRQLLNRKCKEGVEIVAFGEIVKGASAFTINQTTYLNSPLPLILMSGNTLTVQPVPKPASKKGKKGPRLSMLTLDDWLTFVCPKETASQLAILRKRLQSAFASITNHSSKGVDHLSEDERDAIDALSAVIQSAYREAPERQPTLK